MNRWRKLKVAAAAEILERADLRVLLSERRVANSCWQRRVGLSHDRRADDRGRSEQFDRHVRNVAWRFAVAAAFHVDDVVCVFGRVRWFDGRVVVAAVHLESALVLYAGRNFTSLKDVGYADGLQLQKLFN